MLGLGQNFPCFLVDLPKIIESNGSIARLGRVSKELVVETENRKLTILSFIILSAVAAYILYLTLTLAADIGRFGGSNVFGTGLSWTVVGGSVSGVLGLVCFLVLSLNHTALEFSDEVFGELKKVTWPGSKDTAMSTVVVSIMVVIAALAFMLMDFVWGHFFGWIL
ncbi:MAG: preprotein translocase subunit SecE [Bradymonadales bacterium]|nr:MAG: preprotein translocase subunit SecE [Bradymonadales bacterium]